MLTKDSDKINQKIERLAKRGVPIPKIGATVGRSRENVYLRLRKMGIDPPRAKYGRVDTDERIKEIMEFLKEPRTWQELCDELDISEWTIAKDLHRIEERGLGQIVLSLKK